MADVALQPAWGLPFLNILALTDVYTMATMHITMAERFEISDGKLMIYSEGMDQPTVLAPHVVPADEPVEG